MKKRLVVRWTEDHYGVVYAEEDNAYNVASTLDHNETYCRSHLEEIKEADPTEDLSDHSMVCLEAYEDDEGVEASVSKWEAETGNVYGCNYLAL